MSADELCILAIDDDPGDLELLRRALGQVRGLDVSLVCCSSAAEGTRRLAERRVDAIFLDYRLGAMDGLDVLRDIRLSDATCPVIFLTGQGNEWVAAESRRVGANDYIRKADLSPEVLRRSIEYVLEAQAQEEEQAAFQESLVRMATLDPLTGLMNRRAFTERFEHECARTECFGNPLVLMAVDIDGFRRINRQRGEYLGDQVLARTAICLRGLLRPTDILCRYHADQFLAALTESDAHRAQEVAERVRSQVAESPIAGGDEGPVELSCTIALLPIEAPDIVPEKALYTAFCWMGMAKLRGGDQVVLIRPGDVPAG